MKSEITKEHIKEIKRLHESKERAERGLFLVEGVRFMEEAVKEKVHLEEVLYTERLEEGERGSDIIAALSKLNVPLFQVSQKVMDAVSETENPQGILGVARQFKWTIGDITERKGPIIVACGLQDPGNLGTIIRTADAGGAAGIITASDTVDLYNSKVVRATVGSIFRLPVARVDDIKKSLTTLKSAGYQLVATSLKSRVSYLDIDFCKPTVFLIGRESSGLSSELLELADKKVFIPMREGVESLNAAVSASILIYEALRQQHS